MEGKKGEGEGYRGVYIDFSIIVVGLGRKRWLACWLHIESSL